MDVDSFKPKRWEGKPWAFKFKFLYANYPEAALGAFVSFLIIPALVAYKIYTYPDSRPDVVRKFKSSYIVVRDDDPLAEFYQKENERGKHLFPKY